MDAKRILQLVLQTGRVTVTLPSRADAERLRRSFYYYRNKLPLKDQLRAGKISVQISDREEAGGATIVFSANEAEVTN